MKSIVELVRKNIDYKMTQLGLTQTELANRAKIPHQSIYKILRGIRVPTLPLLDKIAFALQCLPSELLQDDAQEKGSLNRREIFDIVSLAIQIQKQKVAFEGLTKANPIALTELVVKFGGWDFLYEYLQEEFEIRSEAERDYQRLRDSINLGCSNKDLRLAKNKMLISKMIAKTGRNT